MGRDLGREAVLGLAELLAPAREGALIGVVWPGDHLSGALRSGALSFPFEGVDADATAAQLARFVRAAIGPGTPLSFVSHSLGARVVLECMRALLGGRHAVDQVYLMAPAVDAGSLAEPRLYRDAVKRATRVAVLHSEADEVLRFAYPTGDMVQAFVFLRRENFGLALGYRGPRSSHATPLPRNVVDCAVGRFAIDHGDYMPAGARQSAEVLSAAAYAAAVLNGAPAPQYPPPA